MSTITQGVELFNVNAKEKLIQDTCDIITLSAVLRYRILCRYASRSPIYDRYREYLRKQL